MGLIDVTSLVGWGIFDIFHTFDVILPIMFSGERRKLIYFFLGGGGGGIPKSSPHACTSLPMAMGYGLNVDRDHGLNVDRGMIKAPEHDMLDHAKVE